MRWCLSILIASKAVNDTAGHARRATPPLRELASLMLTMLRSSDVLARLGGMNSGRCCRLQY